MGSRQRLAMLLGAFLGMAAVADVLHAQRDDVVVDGPVPVAPDYITIRREAALIQLRMRQLGQGNVRLDDDAVYQWVFGDVRNLDQATKQFELLLRSRIDEIVLLCAASDEQRKKLELAGQVDIWRFLDRVEDLRSQGQQAKDPAQITMLQQQAQRLKASHKEGLFHERSLFAKTARTALTSEQFEQANRPTAFQHRAHVARVAVLLKDELRMSDQQQRALVALLLAETRPPRQPGEYGFQVAMLEMQRVPESKLKPLFNDQQWQLLNRQFELVQWMEPFLKQNGFLHETEPARSK